MIDYQKEIEELEGLIRFWSFFKPDFSELPKYRKELEELKNGIKTNMDNTRTNNLKEYAGIKTQIVELEAKLKELQPYIIDMVDEEGGKIVDKDLGVFYFSERTTWEYSPVIREIEQDLKDKKKIEELQKVATVKSISRALCYRKEFKEEEAE